MFRHRNWVYSVHFVAQRIDTISTKFGSMTIIVSNKVNRLNLEGSFKFFKEVIKENYEDITDNIMITGFTYLGRE